jgi:hypothetical protein
LAFDVAAANSPNRVASDAFFHSTLITGLLEAGIMPYT